MPTWAERDATRAAEKAARTAYGRLTAWLAARTSDLATAEDALADAFAAALAAWPKQGVPDRPEAWLMRAARRRLIDLARKQAVRSGAAPALALLEEEKMDGADPDLPDHRLGLMFLCAHPAIDPAIRTPLMLQTVLGLDAARIAGVFMVSPAAMSQRLVRAKAKIRDAGIPFGVPDRAAWTPRLGAVLDAIYAAYTAGWEPADRTEPRAAGLAEEAEWLARLLVELLPDSGEAHGLLGLILYSEARAPARRGLDGAYIPLSEQDTDLWDRVRLADAGEHLGAAAAATDSGRYQIEAAIQSVHAARAITGETDHAALLALYDALMQVSPSLGAAIARAAVLGEVQGPQAGLAALDALPAARLDAHLPYWATRGHLLANAGKREAAQAALSRAGDLANDPALADWLRARAGALT